MRKKIRPLSPELQQMIIDELKATQSDELTDGKRTESIVMRVTPGIKQRLEQLAEYEKAKTGKFISVSSLVYEYICDGIEADTYEMLRKK